MADQLYNEAAAAKAFIAIAEDIAERYGVRINLVRFRWHHIDSAIPTQAIRATLTKDRRLNER